MATQKRILICPLDWGLGHATRCIPIIRQLIAANAIVIIAADKRPLALLQREFPQLQFVVFTGYEIDYPAKGSMILKMVLHLPKLIRGVWREHRALKHIIKQYEINAVISDSRFGLWSRQVPCVFITHQLCIRAPFAEKLVYRLNRKIINQYTTCWVPDTEASLLSGQLSSKYKPPLNSRFIGSLSRFTSTTEKSADIEPFILALVSGPEPQRSIFEQLLITQLTALNIKAIIVRGIPEYEGEVKTKLTSALEVINHLPSAELQNAINAATLVISRPGYSTVMDLAVLGKKAIFIPTPGQTEQEYLSTYFMLQKIAFAQAQNKLDLAVALEQCASYSGFTYADNNYYKQIIDKWLEAV